MSIGNDIVDLDDAGEPSERFLARVLAPGEIAGGARDVWKLWAAKEAAFKLLKREDPSLPFAHRRFAVDVRARLVRHAAGAMPVNVRWEQREQAVACVAWRGRGDVSTAWATVDEVRGALTPAETRGVTGRPSIAARLLLKRLLHERLGLHPSEIEILRPGGRPPEVWRRGAKMDEIEVSLSHDGRYVACAVIERNDAWMVATPHRLAS